MYERVIELAKKKGLSISKLERLADLANGTISQWKDGDARGRNIVKIAKILEVSTDYLLGMTEEQ